MDAYNAWVIIAFGLLLLIGGPIAKVLMGLPGGIIIVAPLGAVVILIGVLWLLGII